MADRDRDPASRPGRLAPVARKLLDALSRIDVLGAVTIVPLCAAFVLGTGPHRTLFYIVALPVFLVHLRAYDWRSLAASPIAVLSLVYLAYFLLCSLWSDALSGGSFADLLRVSVLLLLYFLMVLRLGVLDDRFLDRFAFWYALAAGASLLLVFAASATGLLTTGWRFAGFGLAKHPIIGATLYGVALLFCAFVLLPRAQGWRERLLWLAVIALSAGFMLLASSRGPLFALGAALVVGLAVADRRLAIAVAVVLLAGIAAGLLTDLRAVERIFTRAPSGHFDVWQQALTAITERPWFGYGSLTDLDFESKHGTVRSPHNLLLANQIYGGLPATLLLLALLALATRQAWLAVREGKPVYLVLLVFGLTASLFDSRSLVQNLGREWVTLWLPIGLLAAREAFTRRAPS